MSWLLAFGGFAALIVLHELGHFAAAKAVGMRVERFALFFPPLLFKVRRGETEYGVGAIPLGGYVRITGMNPNEELPEEVRPRAYYAQPVWKRVVVIAAGPAMNLLVCFAIIWTIFVFDGQPTGQATNEVQRIGTGTPAAQVLQDGDRLLAVDGRRGTPDELRAQLATHRCAGQQTDGCVAATPAVLTIERAGRELTVEARPRYDAEAERPLLGFGFAPEIDRLGPAEAIGQSFAGMWRVTKATVSAITGVFVSAEKREEVSGVVGSYETTRQTIQTSTFTDTMTILAIISLSLAIVNLFPFLPLDGGHIFWAVAEKVRGRPIPFALMERASVVGFMLVIFLFFVGLTNDIGRLQGEGFGLP